MDGPLAGIVVFACLSSATLLGAGIRARLPAGLVSADSHSAIRRGVWIIAIMAGVLLSTLTVYLKTHFDTATRDVRAFSFQLVDLDRTLRRIGPPAATSRALLFRYAARTMKDVWPATNPHLGPQDTHAVQIFNELETAISGLQSTTLPLRDFEATARRLLHEVGRARWKLDERAGQSVSPWIISIIVLWLMFTFASLGLSTQRSRAGLAMLILCAASLSSAVFLAVEYADPYQGVIIVSYEPLQNALFALSE